MLIHAKAIKDFYYAENKELWLTEERFKELQSKGYVEEVKDKESKIEKATEPKKNVEKR